MLHLRVEPSNESEFEQCFSFRVKMSTPLWRMRARLSNELNVLDADRIEIQVRDRVVDDHAARWQFVCQPNMSALSRGLLIQQSGFRTLREVWAYTVMMFCRQAHPLARVCSL